MNNYASLDTFYILDIASKFDFGHIIMGEYIPPDVLNDTVTMCASHSTKTSANLKIYTTNHSITCQTDHEEIVYVSPRDLKEETTQVFLNGPGHWVDGVFTGETTTMISPAPENLFNYLFGEGGEYEDLACEDWSSRTVSCILGGNSEADLEEAIQNYLI
jgi:hypothetical protein